MGPDKGGEHKSRNGRTGSEGGVCEEKDGMRRVKERKEEQKMRKKSLKRG